MKDNLNEMTKKLLFDDSSVIKATEKVSAGPFSWSKYDSSPNGQSLTSRPTDINTFTHSLIKHETEKLAARKFGISSVNEYEGMKQYMTDNNITASNDSDVYKAKNEYRMQQLRKSNPDLDGLSFTNEQLDSLDAGSEVTASDNNIYAEM